MDQDLLVDTIGWLQHHRHAATYEALAGVVGGTPETVMADLPRSFRNSWIVDRETRRPTGYEPEQIHPELFTSIETNGVIDTPEQLLDWLSTHRKFVPQDDWERGLLSLGKDCGTSPPPSAWTREEMYD